jgi:hypothetical protein
MEPFGWPQTSRGSDPDALPNPVTPRGAGRSQRESPPPAARREESAPESGNARAGEQSIDIPGFSQKAIRFPALELHESGESPDAPTRPIREELQTPVSRGEASIERREIRRENTFVEAPDLARAAARRATERVDHVPRVPRDLGKRVPSETMTPDHVRPERDIESLPVFRGPARDRAVRDQTLRDRTLRDLTLRDLTMMPASTPRSGIEAPIGPGRQVASPVTRRAEGPETPPQDIDFATRAPNRPDPPPQVVVVNRAHPYPPSRTPAAFWERSYLGHLFRLRRLR